MYTGRGRTYINKKVVTTTKGIAIFQKYLRCELVFEAAVINREHDDLRVAVFYALKVRKIHPEVTLQVELVPS